MLNNATPNNVRLHLYKNNQTPAESDTTANYTESTSAGYTQKELLGSQWTVSTSSGTSTATFARQTFTYTTSETLYGYYLTNQANTTVIWAERFTGAPFSIPTGGGSVDIDARIALD